MLLPESESRRSDRVTIELPIEVSGSDATGRAFLAEGKTVVIARDGAKILLATILVPEQEINLRCVETGKEATARIVGKISDQPEGSYYGVKFLDEEANPWGVEFPTLSEESRAVGRVVVECVACHTREVAHLDEFELEVLEVNDFLSRYCKRCSDTSIWKKSFAKSSAEAAAEEKELPKQEQRGEPRREMKVQACVRSMEYRDEVVTTRNISRNGVCFASQRAYQKGWQVEIAVPYSKGGGNIFLAAKIARVERLAAEGVSLYGAYYLRPGKDR